MATASENSKGIGGGDGKSKAIVADHITQAVNSTSNLLHLMRQSSSSQAQLAKLPKNLLAKASLKATGQTLAQLPQVISSLDAHTESGLHSGVHLNTIPSYLKTWKALSFVLFYNLTYLLWTINLQSPVKYLRQIASGYLQD